MELRQSTNNYQAEFVKNSNTHVGRHGLEMMLLWRQIFVLRCNKDNIIDKYVAEGVNQAPLMKPARNAGA